MRQFMLTNLEFRDGFRWRCNLASIENYGDEIAGNPLNMALTLENEIHFIYGGDSDYASTDGINAAMQIFPNAQFHCLPGAGHWVHAEKPGEFSQLVMSFQQN